MFHEFAEPPADVLQREAVRVVKVHIAHLWHNRYSITVVWVVTQHFVWKKRWPPIGIVGAPN